MMVWRRLQGSLRAGRRTGPQVRPSSRSIVPTNLPSPPASTTRDGHERREAIFRDILRPLRPGRLLDLGTGHGAFATVAHELGWQVTAVDARTSRMPMTPGIDWVQSDVRAYDVSGFDCIALLGLLYHLEYADVVDLLRRCAGTVTILDTHTANHVTGIEDGYEGRSFTEIADYTPERLVETPTASWGNPTSWWPTRQALVRMLEDVGFGTILVLDPPTQADRTFYLCLPPASR